MVSDCFSLFICVLVSAFSVISGLPEGWSVCKLSSPDHEECLKNQINHAIHFFKHGNNKMGIIPLDPLLFDSMVIEQGTGPVSVTMNMTKVKFTGLSNARVTSIKNDWKKMFIEFFVPHIQISGDYFGKGQIMVMPIHGDGQFYINWENMVVTFDMTLTHTIKNGKTYLQVQKMPVVLTPKELSLNLGNLFNGNKEMGDHMNQFLNENWQELLEDLMPAISRTLQKGFIEYINRVLCLIPAEEIEIK